MANMMSAVKLLKFAHSQHNVNSIIAQRRTLRMLLQIHRAKLLQLFSPHPMDQQGSPCCHNFMTVSQSYHSKVTPIGELNAKKIVKQFCSMYLQQNSQGPSQHMMSEEELKLRNGQHCVSSKTAHCLTPHWQQSSPYRQFNNCLHSSQAACISSALKFILLHSPSQQLCPVELFSARLCPCGATLHYWTHVTLFHGWGRAHCTQL